MALLAPCCRWLHRHRKLRSCNATTIVSWSAAMMQRRKARGGFCAMHLRCIAAFSRECDARKTNALLRRPYFCQRAITLFTATAVINSPGNRNFSRLCGWVKINCLDCRRDARFTFRTFYLLTSRIRAYN